MLSDCFAGSPVAVAASKGRATDRSLRVGSFNRRNVVAILSGYNSYFDCSLDDPGKVDDPETVVGGYISSVEAWEGWQIDWRLSLAKFNVPHFHMREFLSYSGAFIDSKWKLESYRAQFLSELVSVINRFTIATFASFIKKSMFDSANGFFELDKHANPYSLCSRDCSDRAHKFIRETYKSEMAVAYIFEKGDKGAGMLIDLMEWSKLPRPIFKRPRFNLKNPKLDQDDPPAIQLQACDLIAWEVRRGKKDWALKQKLRSSLFALGKGKHKEWKECTHDALSVFITKKRIPLRQEWRHLLDYPSFGPYKNWECTSPSPSESEGHARV